MEITISHFMVITISSFMEITIFNFMVITVPHFMVIAAGRLGIMKTESVSVGDSITALGFGSLWRKCITSGSRLPNLAEHGIL